MRVRSLNISNWALGAVLTLARRSARNVPPTHTLQARNLFYTLYLYLYVGVMDAHVAVYKLSR